MMNKILGVMVYFSYHMYWKTPRILFIWPRHLLIIQKKYMNLFA